MVSPRIDDAMPWHPREATALEQQDAYDAILHVVGRADLSLKRKLEVITGLMSAVNIDPDDLPRQIGRAHSSKGLL